MNTITTFRNRVTSATTGTIAMLAVAITVLVQCSSAPPPAPPSPPSMAAPSPTPTAATIQPVTAADLGPSWHPGCPIEPRELRRVEVDFIGFDGQTQRGALIVNEEVAADVVAIFEQLLQLHYPIEKIRTVVGGRGIFTVSIAQRRMRQR